MFPWYPVAIEEGVAVQWERNPYYYKIDPAGNQLPYVDRIQMDLGGRNLENVNLKIINGQIDYIAEGLPLENLPLYTENEESGGYKVMLLPYWRSFPNLVFFNYVAPDDPELTGIFQDLRFRQAVSLAIDRDEMNEALYLNLGQADPVLAVSVQSLVPGGVRPGLGRLRSRPGERPAGRDGHQVGIRRGVPHPAQR